MMDLEFSGEQEMLREMVRGLLAQHSPLTKVRELEDDPTGYDPALWSQLQDLDLVGLLLPEEAGGSGQSMLEGVVLYEELGRSLAPTPHFVSAVADRRRAGRRGRARRAARRDRLGREDRHRGLARARRRLQARAASRPRSPTAAGSPA